MNDYEYYVISKKAYKLACLYMGKTELYDRSLTGKRSKYDKTEALIDFELYDNSRGYANIAKTNISQLAKLQGFSWLNIQAEIYSHKYYSAQEWVNEYIRLWQDDKEKNNEYKLLHDDSGQSICEKIFSK